MRRAIINFTLNNAGIQKNERDTHKNAEYVK